MITPTTEQNAAELKALRAELSDLQQDMDDTLDRLEDAVKEIHELWATIGDLREDLNAFTSPAENAAVAADKE